MPRLICFRWAHMPFCWFCYALAHFFYSVILFDTLMNKIRSEVCVDNFAMKPQSRLNIYPLSHHLVNKRQNSFHIMGPRHAKTCLRDYADGEVWSGPSLFADRIIGHYRMHQWRANARMRLCAYMGWIWICAFGACSKTNFCLARPN